MYQSSNHIRPESSKGSASGEIGTDERLCHHASESGQFTCLQPALFNNAILGSAGDGSVDSFPADDTTGVAFGVEGEDQDADDDPNGTDTNRCEACIETEEPLSVLLEAKDIKHPIDYLSLAKTSGAMGFEELHALNLESGLFNESPDTNGITHRELTYLVEACVRSLDTALVVQLVKARDDDIAVKVLYPIFSDYFMRSMRTKHDLPTHLLKRLMHASLESLVMCLRAALKNQDGILYGSDVPEFSIKISRRARVAIYDAIRAEKYFAEEQLYKRAFQMDFTRREQHASPTRHLEAVETLSTASKVQVFINGVIERNKAGELITEVFRNDEFVYAIRCRFQSFLTLRNGDRVHLLRLFSENPYLTVENALDVLDWCLRIQVGTITRDIDAWRCNSFYPVRGCNVKFFCSNFDAIVDQVRLRARSLCEEPPL